MNARQQDAARALLALEGWSMREFGTTTNWCPTHTHHPTAPQSGDA